MFEVIYRYGSIDSYGRGPWYGRAKIEARDQDHAAEIFDSSYPTVTRTGIVTAD